MPIRRHASRQISLPIPAILALLVVALFVAAEPSDIGAAEDGVGAPNIVVILADDMGFGDVGVLNEASTIPTPNLDSLARGGMTFTDSHSPSAVCTPTRYGLVTGRYCWRSPLKRGVLGGYSPPLIEKDRPTIATMLKGAGYRTGAVGKWHLGMQLPMLDGKTTDGNKWDGDPGVDFKGVLTDSPIHHGFDYYFGVTASLDMAPYVFVRNDRFTMQPTIQQQGVKFPHFVRSGPRAEDFVIDEVLDRITEEATTFIAKSSEGEKPFFLYMPLTAPHKPTQPHERFKGKTELGEYGDFVVQVDWTVGQVLKQLKESGVEENTLVVFTSDNGSYMYRYDDPKMKDHTDDNAVQGFRAENHRANGAFRGTKADVWEGGHHVPFFARLPGVIEAGSKCTEPITHTDIFATCASAAGVKVPQGAAEDSYALWPMMTGKEAKRGAPVIHHSAAGMFAIRHGDWKLILGNGSGGRQQPKGKPFGEPYELYNLAKDIGETNNVAAENEDVVKRLTALVAEIRGE